MSLTLKDLRVALDPSKERGHNWEREASLADLVEVLKQEGAEVETAFVSDGYLRVDVPSHGRFLVLPLGTDEA